MAIASAWFIELRARLDKLQADMDGAVGVFTKAEKRINNVMNNVNKVAQAALVLGGVMAVKKLNDAINKLAESGEVAGSIAEGFQKLGGSSASIEAARKNVLGMVDSFDLMKMANSALVKGVPEVNKNFAMMADLGGRLANTLGTDTAGAIQQVVDAFTQAKPKQLEQIGIIIDQDKAYATYAKSIHQNVLDLTDREKTIARQIAGEEKLKDTIEKLAPVTDSVANAQKAVNTAWDEGWKVIGIAFNSNEDLIKSYRHLAEEIDKINWRAIGDDIAYFVSNIADLISYLSPLTEKLHEVVVGLKTISSLAHGKSMASTIVDLYLPDMADKLQTGMKEAAKTKEWLDKMFDGDKTNPTGKPKLIPGAPSTEDLDGIRQHAKQAADEVQKLKDKWAESIGKDEVKNLDDQLQIAVDNLNSTNFEALKKNLGEAVREGYINEWKELIAKDPGSEPGIRAQAAKLADLQTAEWQKKFEDKSEEAYKNSIDTWRGLFENAITGATFDLESALKQVAVGFAAQMAQAVFGSIGGINIKGPADIGGMIFSSIFGGGKSAGGVGNIGGAAAGAASLSSIIGSTGTTAASAQAAGIAGPATSSGMMTEGSGILGFASSNPYTAAAIAALVAGYFMRNKIQTAFGGGTTNKETLRRMGFTGQLEDMFKPQGGFKFFNEQGQAQNVTDFKRLAKGFDAKDWGTQWNKTPNAGAFNNIGMALGAALGTKTPLEQIGKILHESIGGSLEGLKALIQSTGISTQEFTDKLIGVGKQGKQSWLEIVGSIHSVEDAMKPGLAKVGAYTDAMDNLLQTGAKGQIALNQVKNIGIEASEAQIKSLEALKAQLMASGKYSPETISAFFEGVSQQGIKSLDALANASDRSLAEIVAHMQAKGVQFTDAFKPLQDTMSALQEMPDSITKDITFNVTSNLDKNSQALAGNVAALNGLAFYQGGKVAKLAAGGVVSGTTLFRHAAGLGMMGEAGPEGVLPLKRINGKLGVSTDGGSGGVVFHIDARGAEIGVEQRIRAIAREIEGRAVKSAISGLMDISRGGGRASRSL